MKVPRPRTPDEWIAFRPQNPGLMLQTYSRRFQALESAPGVSVKTESIRGKPFQTVRVKATGPDPIRVFLSAAAHGDERAGVPAAYALIQWVLRDPELRRRVDLTVIPFINPTGYANDTRNNDEGVNVNREHKDGSTLPEVKGVQATLEEGPFQLAIDLHGSEDMREGFFVIANEVPGEQGKVPGTVAALATRAIQHAASVGFPIADTGTPVYNRAALGLYTTVTEGVLNKYFGEHGTDASYTIEAPHAIPYEQRIEGLVAFVKSLVTGKLEERRSASQPQAAADTSLAARPAKRAAASNDAFV